ncbi:MAG: PfaD family polyunsaturated fatty acid/polyketide biosynthesis protein [Desulfobacterales bacterium]|nr:PfaD family polyunsaturated fatty acid/polyketide biosynthesis protein [Desulfobacterales bacterium]
MQSSFNVNNRRSLGWWNQGDTKPELGYQAVGKSILRVAHPVLLLNLNDQIAVGSGGTITIGDKLSLTPEGIPLWGYCPPLHPENLGSAYFKKMHHLRYAYIAGAMANGITSIKMVSEMGHAGMIGFFGAAGLPIEEIEAAIMRLQREMGHLPFGFNLIYSPNDPELEAAVVDLYLRKGIRLISASAYLDYTLPLVYYRVKGIYSDNNGNIICPNKIIAKVSRIEVAKKFFSPPPEKILVQLVNQKLITRQEADLAKFIPLADDLTAEADSGGHTDNRPAISLLPTMLALRDRMVSTYKYKKPLSVGLGGGIATPYSAAAAFAMGADYLVTGSINQACVEAGISEAVRQMLAEATQADVTMAPAADMFEMGVKVQVLKRSTMFPLRAAKLYELYNRYNRLEDLPDNQRTILERDFFRCSLEQEWKRIIDFFAKRDPKQISQAEKDPKHRMALVFRSYLGRSSTWAKTGDPSRKIDYQIWCGPAIGAFNEWVRGSFLEKPENRKVTTVAMNLLFGAAVQTRTIYLRNQGIELPISFNQFSPMELSNIITLLNN